MTVSPFIRQQSVALRTAGLCSRQALPRCRVRRRHLHSVPQLSNGDQFEKDGVPGMLSAAGYNTAWIKSQAWLVQRLNLMTEGTSDENVPTKSLVLKYARQADRSALFNYASMAHNNHLFFAGLGTTSREPSSWFTAQIDTAFSSFSSLRSTFLATANGMFGPGFIWLVARIDPSLPSSAPRLAILNSYLAGSPYPGAHFRQQPADVSTSDTDVRAGDSAQVWAMRQQGFGASAVGLQGVRGPGAGFGRGTRVVGPGGQDLEVLMGVSTWEHVWLQDWGIGGKRAYLEAWWDRVDWDIAERNWNERPKGTSQGLRSGRLELRA